NIELQSVADVLAKLDLFFPVKAGETGKLYGSVSAQAIADRIKAETDIELERNQLVTEPIRNLGEYMIPVNLTLDLVPEVRVVVHREGEVFVPEVVEEFVEIEEIEEAEEVEEIEEENSATETIEE
ncbi:MAG: 50S ribosomal L9 C-terminal domain-containing protein, partial [Anaerolineaceae bacterium]|nr:50S ribosomal L9 C-terminal domain-containing protein [Anaerolineaceae bacterium]